MTFATTDRAPTLRAHVLALLSLAMPPALYDREDHAEAAFLKPFRERFAGFTSQRWLDSFRDAMAHPAPEDEDRVRLVQHQAFSLLEGVALFLCLEVENDAMTGRCIAFLQQPLGGSRPTLSLFSTLVKPLIEAAAIPVAGRTPTADIATGGAVRSGVLHIVNAAAPLAEQALQMPPAVALALSGQPFSWPGGRLGMNGPLVDLPASIREQAGRQAKALRAIPGSILILRSPSLREAEAAAAAIADGCEGRPLFIDDQDRALPALGVICRQKHLVPVLHCAGGPGERTMLPEIMGYDGPLMVVAGLEGTFGCRSGSITSWTIPIPRRPEREALWRHLLGDPDLARRLAEDHLYSAARITELAAVVRRQVIAGEKSRATPEDILDAAWLSENSGLASLAQPVTTKVDRAALVVRPLTSRQLDLLENRCRRRENLGDRLGITLKAGYRMGVKALFIGPSGTGKTLATSWLASRLGTPLYRVDLASLTSKYVGETEKNLAQLLGQAEQQEVVLLFDEADSVFGKRTEISDANDRFANAQTNYLLQRIETFSGVVILTSNSRARFDKAFTRRLDMMIEFPLPSPEERRAIWRNHLGTHHRLTRRQLNQLSARCDLAGGYIRNVVLTAAVSAQQADRTISFLDIALALEGEYRKLGKQLPPEFKVAAGPGGLPPG